MLDQTIDNLQEGDIVAISSKIVALCEGNVRPLDTDRDTLIEEQSDLFLPPEHSKYGHHFSIINHTIVGSAGIDVSNADDHFVLWPKDPQADANNIRAHLREHFGLKNLGVIITDSISQPLRLGSIGASISHSGFSAIHDYRGQSDLFGHTMKVSRSNVASGLAAAAVLVMGEGTEQTPICIIRDASFVAFQDHNPTQAELDESNLSLEDDLFAPFLQNARWQEGQHRAVDESV